MYWTFLTTPYSCASAEGGPGSVPIQGRRCVKTLQINGPGPGAFNLSFPSEQTRTDRQEVSDSVSQISSAMSCQFKDLYVVSSPSSSTHSVGLPSTRSRPLIPANGILPPNAWACLTPSCAW